MLQLLLCSLISFSSHAFMNIESIRQNSKAGASGSLGLKFNGQSGNSENLTSELTTLNLHRSDENEWLLAGKYRYGESRQVKNSHEANLHFRYTREVSATRSCENFVQTEFDEFKKLKRRDLVGTGLRTRLDKGEHRAFYLGTGFFYEQQKFEQDFRDERTVRANVYLSFVRTFTDHVSGQLIAYYQPSVKSFGDTRAQVDSSLQVRLTGKLALTLEYDLQFDREPAPGVKQTDSTYLAGLNYSY